MAKSKSQARREAVMASEEKPDWQNHQQEQTEAKDNETRAAENEQASSTGKLKIKLKTDYMDIGKAGQVIEQDQQKADELVRLGRAEYVK